MANDAFRFQCVDFLRQQNGSCRGEANSGSPSTGMPPPFYSPSKKCLHWENKRGEVWGSGASQPLPIIYGAWWVPLALLDGDRRMSGPIPSTVPVVAGWGHGIRAAAGIVDCRAWAICHVPSWNSSPCFLLMMSSGVVGPRLPPEGMC